MIAWMAEPKFLTAVPFRKHRGVKWEDAPIEYLQWMVCQAEMDKDALWHAQKDLNRRL